MDYNITYRKKDGSWQYIISCKDGDTGKWKQIKSKQGFALNMKGKGECKEAAEKAVDELKEQSKIVVTEYTGITFEKFSKIYINHTKLYTEPNTVIAVESALKKFSKLNPIEMIKITPIDIQESVDEMTRECLNPNTVKEYLRRLKTMFNLAITQYKILTINPTITIKTGSPREVIKKALNDVEVSALLECVKKSRYYLVIYIALNSGMRVSEIFGLTWKDINTKKNQITVNKQWKKNKAGVYSFGELKSKNSYRIIPISSDVAKELARFRNVLDENIRIFPFIKTDSTISLIDRYMSYHGFDVSMHELRHTYATKVISKGMDFKTAAAILGDNVAQIIKTYSHVNSDMMDNARKLIENIF